MLIGSGSSSSASSSRSSRSGAEALARSPQTGVDKTLGVGQRGGSKAPGKLGEWLPEAVLESRKATNKSASKGREGRSGKLPL